MKCFAKSIVIAAFASTACGNDPAPDSMAPPEECPDCLTATMPSLPEIPCSRGFVRMEREDDPGTCEPWNGPAIECDRVDEAHFAGESGCSRVSVACPDGDFPSQLPEGRSIVYVVPDGGATGDGSMARPYGNLRLAIESATDGDVLALARGTYTGPFRISKDLTLFGACPAETTLTAADASSVVIVQGGAVAMENMQVTSDEGSAITAFNAEVTIHGVVIDSARGYGIYSDESDLDIDGLIVRDVSPNYRSDEEGRGVWIYGGDTVAHRVFIERASEFGVFVSVGTATIEGLAVRDTRPSRMADFGRGVAVQEGGTAIVSHAVIEGSREAGATVLGEGSRLVLEDSIIRDTRGRPDRQIGRGVIGQDGAILEMSRTTVEGSHETGVSLFGTTATFTDVVIRDTAERQTDMRTGRGLHVDEATRLEAQRVYVARNAETGLAVMAQGSYVHVEDFTVVDTFGQAADHMFGRGLSIQSGAVVDGERVFLDRNREGGAFVAGRDTQLTARDLTSIRSIPPGECDGGCSSATYGMGISAIDRGSLSLERFVVTQSELCGVFLHSESQIALTGGEVSDNPIGACLQEVEEIDYGMLDMGGVRWVRNGSNLQSVELPLPEPLTDLHGM